jgi:putative SOS response-associated peptidase YedK
MRYQCRPAGKPAFYDTKYPGTYNARRDSLEGFWKDQFGSHHAVMVANAFFENVSKHRTEGRELRAGEKEENVVLEFRPKPTQDMLLACLWSHWTEGEESLLSFAAITDEPPAEVAAERSPQPWLDGKVRSATLGLVRLDLIREIIKLLRGEAFQAYRHSVAPMKGRHILG